MISSSASSPFVAIACGGTGGHLFPGLAIAEQLQQRGCAVALLISPKEVDQQSVQSARGMEILTLPAVALQNRNYFSFAACFWRSWRAAARFFQQRRPDAVLAMGGFTSAPPILAAKDAGAGQRQRRCSLRRQREHGSRRRSAWVKLWLIVWIALEDILYTQPGAEFGEGTRRTRNKEIKGKWQQTNQKK